MRRVIADRLRFPYKPTKYTLCTVRKYTHSLLIWHKFNTRWALFNAVYTIHTFDTHVRLLNLLWQILQLLWWFRFGAETYGIYFRMYSPTCSPWILYCSAMYTGDMIIRCQMVPWYQMYVMPNISESPKCVLNAPAKTLFTANNLWIHCNTIY